MKKNRDIIKEFSRRTGIVDPVIDNYFDALEETKLESVEDFSKRTGITDPRIDHFIDRQDKDENYLHGGSMYGIDWGFGNREPHNQFTRIYYTDWVQGNYRPHPAQERFFASERRWAYNPSPRGQAVMTGIRPWNYGAGEEIDLIIRDTIEEEALINKSNKRYVNGEWKEADKKLPPPPLKLKSPPTDPET